MNHLWQQFSLTIKHFQERFVRSRRSSTHYSQVSLGLIGNAKNMSEEKSIFITNQREQAETLVSISAARSRKHLRKDIIISLAHK